MIRGNFTGRGFWSWVSCECHFLILFSLYCTSAVRSASWCASFFQVWVFFFPVSEHCLTWSTVIALQSISRSTAKREHCTPAVHVLRFQGHSPAGRRHCPPDSASLHMLWKHRGRSWCQCSRSWGSSLSSLQTPQSVRGSASSGWADDLPTPPTSGVCRSPIVSWPQTELLCFHYNFFLVWVRWPSMVLACRCVPWFEQWEVLLPREVLLTLRWCLCIPSRWLVGQSSVDTSPSDGCSIRFCSASARSRYSCSTWPSLPDTGSRACSYTAPAWVGGRFLHFSTICLLFTMVFFMFSGDVLFRKVSRRCIQIIPQIWM